MANDGYASKLVGTMQDRFKIGAFKLKSSTQLEVQVAGSGTTLAAMKMSGLVIPTGAVNGYVWTTDATGVGSWQAPGSAPVQQALLTFEGEVTVDLNPLRIYNQTGTTRTITKVFLAVNTAPTGAALIVDIKKNGSTIFTTNPKPQINASANTGSVTTIDVSSWADGDYLQAEVTQIGSTITGSNLTVHIVYS